MPEPSQPHLPTHFPALFDPLPMSTPGESSTTRETEVDHKKMAKAFAKAFVKEVVDGVGIEGERGEEVERFLRNSERVIEGLWESRLSEVKNQEHLQFTVKAIRECYEVMTRCPEAIQDTPRGRSKLWLELAIQDVLRRGIEGEGDGRGEGNARYEAFRRAKGAKLERLREQAEREEEAMGVGRGREALWRGVRRLWADYEGL